MYSLCFLSTCYVPHTQALGIVAVIKMDKATCILMGLKNEEVTGKKICQKCRNIRKEYFITFKKSVESPKT